ncbi:ricin-type beta-trefoil lectin domain protein [Catenulispora yoronensis]
MRFKDTPRRRARHRVGALVGALIGALALAATSLAAVAITAAGAQAAATAVAKAALPAATTPKAAASGVITGYQGLCLDDYAASNANGTKADLYTCNGTPAQQWTVAANGTLQINGKCLDITGAATGNGALIELWDCNGGGNQVWQAQPNGELLNPVSGRCLDDPGFNATPGTQLDLWDCNAGANQIWTLPTGTGTGGSLGPNVIVISPSQSVSAIASELNAIGTQQNPNQFGTQRYEILFQPGTYGSAANPLDFQIGYYESVQGLGQNPGQVVINGTIDSWNQCTNGDQTQCYATNNFYRSISNLTINVTGLTGCFAGEEVWAASQAAPMRRVAINGNTTLMDYCDGTPAWASGGFIADSELNGTVQNGSQQQYLVRNTTIGSWTNGVWNQVFSGDPGAPAQSFSTTPVSAGGPQPYTTLATSPITEEEPYLYTDSSGNYNVFVPSVRTNSSGPSWANGNTPGTSLPLSAFYVVNSASTITQINAALAAATTCCSPPGSTATTRRSTSPRPTRRSSAWATRRSSRPPARPRSPWPTSTASTSPR